MVMKFHKKILIYYLVLNHSNYLIYNLFNHKLNKFAIMKICHKSLINLKIMKYTILMNFLINYLNIHIKKSKF
jgi:hypothetical protein